MKLCLTSFVDIYLVLLFVKGEILIYFKLFYLTHLSCISIKQSPLSIGLRMEFYILLSHSWIFCESLEGYNVYSSYLVSLKYRQIKIRLPERMFSFICKYKLFHSFVCLILYLNGFVDCE